MRTPAPPPKLPPARAGAGRVRRGLAAAALGLALAGLPAGAARAIENCALPPELAAPEVPLPALARLLEKPGATATIVVLGPLTTGARQAEAGIVNYPARLQAALADAYPGRTVKIERVGKPRGNVQEQLRLIAGDVMRLKPALVIWQIGRADARGSSPPYQFGRVLVEGLQRMRGTDVVLMTMQYHPQSEALYRTDDYRQMIRWVSRSTDVPVIDRFEMIEHWASSGLIDLDSGDVEVQRVASDIVQACIAAEVGNFIVAGVASARRPAEGKP